MIGRCATFSSLEIHIIINCYSRESKKLCKKLKIDPEVSYVLKHYKDGEYNKDYDRSETVSSMSNFLRDPTGDLPWDEAPDATDIYHLQDFDVCIVEFISPLLGCICEMFSIYK